MPNVNSYGYQKIHDKKLAESICVAATVQVTAFDPAKMTVNVQPLSKHLANGRYEIQPPILAIPIACTKCGGFIFRPWINVGDVGIVVYLDHDMDSTVSGGKEAVPLTERNHSTTDAVFLGGIVSGSYVASGIPPNSIALSTEDGGVYLAVTTSGVQINGNLSVNGKVIATGEISTESSLNVTADVTAGGGITANGDVVSKGSISGANHTHTDSIGGNTSVPR